MLLSITLQAGIKSSSCFSLWVEPACAILAKLFISSGRENVVARSRLSSFRHCRIEKTANSR